MQGVGCVAQFIAFRLAPAPWRVASILAEGRGPLQADATFGGFRYAQVGDRGGRHGACGGAGEVAHGRGVAARVGGGEREVVGRVGCKALHVHVLGTGGDLGRRGLYRVASGEVFRVERRSPDAHVVVGRSTVTRVVAGGGEAERKRISAVSNLACRQLGQRDIVKPGKVASAREHPQAHEARFDGGKRDHTWGVTSVGIRQDHGAALAAHTLPGGAVERHFHFIIGREELGVGLARPQLHLVQQMRSVKRNRDELLLRDRPGRRAPVGVGTAIGRVKGGVILRELARGFEHAPRRERASIGGACGQVDHLGRRRPIAGGRAHLGGWIAMPSELVEGVDAEVVGGVEFQVQQVELTLARSQGVLFAVVARRDAILDHEACQVLLLFVIIVGGPGQEHVPPVARGCIELRRRCRRFAIDRQQLGQRKGAPALDARGQRGVRLDALHELLDHRDRIGFVLARQQQGGGAGHMGGGHRGAGIGAVSVVR